MNRVATNGKFDVWRTKQIKEVFSNMGTLRDLLFLTGAIERHPGYPSKTTQVLGIIAITLLALVLVAIVIASPQALAAGVHLPGEDASDKLEAAGTLLKLIDTGIFKWGAKVFAGILVMSGGWALKEQRFGIAAICVAGAVVIGTTPKWVKNIFEVGDNQSLFSQSELVPATPSIAFVSRKLAVVGGQLGAAHHA